MSGTSMTLTYLIARPSPAAPARTRAPLRAGKASASRSDTLSIMAAEALLAISHNSAGSRLSEATNALSTWSVVRSAQATNAQMNTTLVEQIASVRSLVLPNVYRDSVELMRVAAELEALPGIQRAALVMATAANREVLLAAHLLEGGGLTAGPSD